MTAEASGADAGGGGVTRGMWAGLVVGVLGAAGGWAFLAYWVSGALRYQADAALAAEAALVLRCGPDRTTTGTLVRMDEQKRPVSTAPDVPRWTYPAGEPPLWPNPIQWSTPEQAGRYAGYRVVFLPDTDGAGGWAAYGKPDGFYSRRFVNWCVGLAGLACLCGAWLGVAVWAIWDRQGRRGG